ncbi:MAG: hypothetical protein ACYCOU_12200 [Sulfobacillus sp.]
MDELLAHLFSGKRIGDFPYLDDIYPGFYVTEPDSQLRARIRHQSEESLTQFVRVCKGLLSPELATVANSAVSFETDLSVSLPTCRWCPMDAREVVCKCENDCIDGEIDYHGTYKKSLGMCPGYVCESHAQFCRHCAKRLCPNCIRRDSCEECYDGSSGYTLVTVGTCEMCRRRCPLYKRANEVLSADDEFTYGSADEDFTFGGGFYQLVPGFKTYLTADEERVFMCLLSSPLLPRELWCRVMQELICPS